MDLAEAEKMLKESGFGAIGEKVVSFMNETDESMFDAADRLKTYLEQHELEAKLAKTGLVLLYGDGISNHLEPGETRGKFKVCAISGNKNTVKTLLLEAMANING